MSEPTASGGTRQRRRVRARYFWAAWAFAAGVAVGFLLVTLLRTGPA